MKKFILIPLAATLLAGCSSMQPEFTDEVVVNTSPSGADVIYNGQVMGQTPMSVTLPRTGNYEITLAKKGYKDELVNLVSVRTQSFVKFGPLVDMGFYKELIPNPVDSNLTSTIIPDSKSINPYSDMTSKIAELDAQRKAGKLSAEEHSLQLKQVIDFYAPKK